ncbi:MAG: DNA photolyase family protein [Crocinitomicaceae bacterium]|nr:DNA photolyase family protein [Crocinitomicaceae bacterium]MDP4868434.1 DNA photolyase family protein [Crocinitomicaceae bacterium]MDP5043128.1 DNA photolyase family protein [Crocinitomicaceae bacterium]
MSTALFWHRRDLRIQDNAGLYKALKNNEAVIPVFIFDHSILQALPKNDQRVLFIHQELAQIKAQYRSLGSDIEVRYGDPKVEIPALAQEYSVQKVYTNRDYEPNALARDQFIFEALQQANIEFIGAKDQVIFEKNEVTKDDGLPYTIYTPYARKWKAKLTAYHFKAYPTEKYLPHLHPFQTNELISLEEMGFEGKNEHVFPGKTTPNQIIENYHLQRDLPAILGTSRLSLHLRFGTISIRALAREAMQLNEKYLNELIWRDFYQAILFHFPQTTDSAFKPQYDRIVWENNEADFAAWCAGKTGYPMVDAGMRELNATGFMHNRVRMVVASFLTKHLLIDWRWGERYFAEKLLDFELASNIGGWQWAAGCGCDAAPYFRVFNPEAQQKKFDPKYIYIKKWVPEFGTAQYALPIVDHKMARERVLTRFKTALQP